MLSLKEAEKLMKTDLTGNNPDLASAFNNMLLVYAYRDFEGKSNHCKIINLLYNTRHVKYNFQGIANMVYINVKTLKRYRENYANCFQYFLQKEQGNKAIRTEAAVADAGDKITTHGGKNLLDNTKNKK